MQIFRTQVVSTTRISEDLIRISFALDHFPTTGVGDEYVRLFFPHTEDRRKVSLPVVDGEGWRTPEGRPDAPMRTYTIRAVREDAIDIDFVVHEGGVAAAWALRATPGDVVGLNSATGLYSPPPDLRWQLFACDLTGLPAAARLIENTPSQVRIRLLAEVPGEASQSALPEHPNLQVAWLHGGNGHGPSRLAEAVRSAVPPDRALDGGYVWVAGPTSELREVRRYLRKERGLVASRYKVVGYWQPRAEEWRERFDSLPEGVRQQLLGLWDDDRDAEEIQDDYEAELERHGL